MNWSIEELHLPLKFSWKISRGSTDFKTNFYIKFSENRNQKIIEGIGEVAPNIRYGETPESTKIQFNKIISNFPAKVNTLHEFNQWIDNQEISNSLRFGMESAFIHFYCKKNQIPIYELLKIQSPEKVITSFSLPIMDISETENFYKQFDLQRFKILKVKIGKENALETVKLVSGLSQKPLMIDANEAWTNVDGFLEFLENLKKYNILFIEQPFPSVMVSEYEYLKSKSPFEIIADESVTDSADFEKLSKQFHGVNMKLMKAGGYQNGIKILSETKKHGLKTMIGCMVETSLGISSALNLSHGINYLDLDSFLYLKNDPSQLIEEKNGELKLL